VYYTYIIFSDVLNAFYVGSTQDLEKRIDQHNNSNGSKFTKRAKDWRVVYSEIFQTRADAQKREYAIKRKKSKTYIEWLIGNRQSVPKAFGKVGG